MGIRAQKNPYTFRLLRFEVQVSNTPSEIPNAAPPILYQILRDNAERCSNIRRGMARRDRMQKPKSGETM